MIRATIRVFLCVTAIVVLFQPIATDAQGDSDLDLTSLPIGTAISSEPEVGAVWSCVTMNGGGAFNIGTWVDEVNGTYDLTAKAVVDGAVVWTSVLDITLQGAVRVISGNGLPNHTTGNYPIASSDDAYSFDRNPNRIQEQAMSIELPAVPELAAQATCVSGGAIGVLLTGSVIFNALDAQNRDAVAYETQDACQGHPERNGTYHYHSLTPCLEAETHETEHSALVGYAFDGFGIYGHHGENGDIMWSADLDECHGHTHLIEWDGEMVEMYHYHATYDYPYTIGCYRGTPVVAQATGGQSQGPQGQPGTTTNPPQGGRPPR